jgi:hypothetical protein
LVLGWAAYEGGSYLGSYLGGGTGYAMPGNAFDSLASGVAGWAAGQGGYGYGYNGGEPAAGSEPGEQPGPGAGPGPALPPPPQDCYAGPDPACTPSPLPAAVVNQPYVTDPVHETPIGKLCADGLCISEKIPFRQGPVKGLHVNINPVNSASTVNDSLALVQVPVSAIGPEIPSVDLPVSGAAITDGHHPRHGDRYLQSALDCFDGPGAPYKGIPGAHSEINAVNQGLFADPGSSISDYIFYNLRLRGALQGEPIEMCSNCASILGG